MKLRKVIIILLILLVVIVGLNYIRVSLRKAATPLAPSRPPSLADAPVRLYGRVEPLGREVFVGPPQPRRVTRIFVAEGQSVRAGQALCELESDIEQQAVQVAMARAAELERRLDLLLDDLKRKETLASSGGVPEFELSQKQLEVKLLRQQIATARAEVELRQRELNTLTLRAPLDGYIYKFDVRLGELLTPQDYQRIVIGKKEKQIRLYVESFWSNRVRVGDVFTVKDAETLTVIGDGEVIAVSEYVGARDFRTDDFLERLDTKYAQAILLLKQVVNIPLGKLVLCERGEK
jgi:multidrug efflux pump subunit AcrA (membrane-fusion protein)